MSALPSVATPESAVPSERTRVLYERYSGRILAYCVSRLGSRHEAEDAMQTTFLNAFRSLQTGVVPQFELAWLFRIAENVCRDGHKSTSRRRRVEATRDLQDLQDTLSAPQAADGLVGLADALASVPERQRQAILLREWQGLSYVEIGRKLQLSDSAVETLIFRARRSLARALEEGRRRASSLDLLSLLAAAKSAFQSGAAVKVAASVVAVGGATLVATVPLADQPRGAVGPAARAPAQATISDVGQLAPRGSSGHEGPAGARSGPRPAARRPAPVTTARAGHIGPASSGTRRSGPTTAQPQNPTTPVDAGPAKAPEPRATPAPSASAPPPASLQPPAAGPELPALPDPPALVPPVPPLEPPPLPPTPDVPVSVPPTPPLPPLPPLPELP